MGEVFSIGKNGIKQIKEIGIKELLIVMGYKENISVIKLNAFMPYIMHRCKSDIKIGISEYYYNEKDTFELICP
jgi:hypothetical protein